MSDRRSLSLGSFRWLRLASVAALLAAGLGGCGTRETRPAGAYKFIDVPRGTAPAEPAPVYLINFDKNGGCESPLTMDDVLRNAKDGGFTDVFVFSHGWNNDWPAATNLYDSLIGGFTAQKADAAKDLGRAYRPLFVGVIWPGTVMMSANERGPRYEFSSDAVTAMTTGETMRREIRDLAAQLADDRPGSADGIEKELESYLWPAKAGDADAARRLAERLAPVCDDEELSTPGRPSAAAALLDAARLAGGADDGPPPAHTGSSGNRPTGNTPTSSPAPATAGASPPAGESAPAGPAGAAPAEARGLPDVRWVFRAASVLMIKDRAGVVGGRGVSKLVQGLVADTDCRVHLVGHSYGAKVLLSAVEAAKFPAGKRVDSVLLLQPAVSANCFAEQVPKIGGSGRYRPVLDRVRTPVFSTFSDRDWPLTTIYHRFVVRSSDLRELSAARESATVEPPPSVYAALGGFGPQPLPPNELADGPFSWTFLKSPGEAYALPASTRVLGLRSRDGQIDGHGDVSNEFTWWALWQQVGAK